MTNNLRKIGITGASGMVGMHTVQLAASLGIRCVTTSRTELKYLPSLVQWQSWDLRNWLDLNTLDTIFGNVDALIHVGAITPRKNVTITDRDLFDANIRSCLCLGLWALHRKVPVVYISGSTVYSDPESPQVSENAPLAHHGCKIGGFYGYTKLLGEEIFTRLTAEGLRLCVLRPSSIYGTGMPNDQMVSVFMNRALLGEDIVIDAPLGSRINIIHAADVASAMIAVLKQGIVGTFNIAYSKSFTILEIAQKVLHVCDKDKNAITINESSLNPFLRFDLNCFAAKKAFGFQPHISLEEGLRLMKDNSFGTLDGHHE